MKKCLSPSSTSKVAVFRGLRGITLQVNKTNRMSSSLDQLKSHTVVVADTGDFEAMKQFSPQVNSPQLSKRHKWPRKIMHARLHSNKPPFHVWGLVLPMYIRNSLSCYHWSKNFKNFIDWLKILSNQFRGPYFVPVLEIKLKSVQLLGCALWWLVFYRQTVSIATCHEKLMIVQCACWLLCNKCI